MSNEAIAAIIAFFVPLLASIVKQAGFSPSVNGIIALVVYVVAGIAGAVFLGPQPVTVETIIAYVVAQNVIGTTAYNLFWSNLGKGTDDAPSLEDKLTTATSIAK